jgi:sugar phosphate isomerase/epimerase
VHVLAFTKPFGPMDVPALADAGVSQRCRDTVRPSMAGLADTAVRHGIRPLLQVHHGTVHPSAAPALALVKDLDVHVYADPGNQAKEGSEAWPLHLPTSDPVAAVRRDVARLRTLRT